MSDQSRRVTRVGAYALCTEDDTILLTRIAPGHTASSDGMWTLPGGGIDFGEHPRDAALRELQEETGMTGEVIDLAHVDSWSGRFALPENGILTDYHAIRVIYRVRITGGALRVEVSGSSDACAWVRRSELAPLPLVELAQLGVRLAFETP